MAPWRIQWSPLIHPQRFLQIRPAVHSRQAVHTAYIPGNPAPKRTCFKLMFEVRPILRLTLRPLPPQSASSSGRTHSLSWSEASQRLASHVPHPQASQEPIAAARRPRLCPLPRRALLYSQNVITVSHQRPRGSLMIQRCPYPLHLHLTLPFPFSHNPSHAASNTTSL